MGDSHHYIHATPIDILPIQILVSGAVHVELELRKNSARSFDVTVACLAYRHQ